MNFTQKARTLNDAPPPKEEGQNSSADDDYLNGIEKEGSSGKKLKMTLQINSIPTHFTIHTGGTEDAMDTPRYNKLIVHVNLKKTAAKNCGYGSDTPLLLQGQFQADIGSKTSYTVSQIHDVQEAGSN